MVAFAPPPTSSTGPGPVSLHLTGPAHRPAAGHGGHATRAAILLAADTGLVADMAYVTDPPAAWRRPGFARRVDAIRAQLEPLGTPDLLAASFAREALHIRRQDRHPGAVRAAYAMRMLESRTGRRLPGWANWVQACAPRP